MSERRGLKALELWCKRVTDGYPGVKIDNMTTSWRDGLAFCAIINHFRPDLIDFASLNKDDIFFNNDLAFRVAQQYLGIPALLDAQDMVEYQVPDRLSIYTYLSQYYRTLVLNSAPTRIAPATPKPSTKMAIRSNSAEVNVEIPRREPCVKCKLPVFLIERLVIGKQLYHNSCFRCARCDNLLAKGNYYETEQPNQFCCETCPNEEREDAPIRMPSVLERSVSDEQKEKLYHADEKFDGIHIDNVEANPARLHFLQGLVKVEEAPPIPSSKPPVMVVGNSFAVFDSGISESCISNTDSLKFSVNSCDKISEVTIEDLSTKEIHCVQLINEEEEEEGKPDIQVWNRDVKTQNSVIEISDESIIEISDDSQVLNNPCSQDAYSLENTNLVSPPEYVNEVKRELEQSTASTNPFADDSDEETEGVTDLFKNAPLVESTPKVKPILPPVQCNRGQNMKKSTYESSLNPFGSEDEEEEVEASTTGKSLNPFSDDDDNDDSFSSGTPFAKKKIIPDCISRLDTKSTGDTPENYKSTINRISDGHHLNPFSSDEDDASSNAEFTIQESMNYSTPKTLFVAESKSIGGSSNSVASSTSASSSVPSTLRKKKQAPKPPIPFIAPDEAFGRSSSPSSSQHPSSRPRKNRRAPLAPTSTPEHPNAAPRSCIHLSPVRVAAEQLSTSVGKTLDFEKEKVAKDEANRQAQSSHYELPMRDKSTYGKWKRKKGQAPALPTPQKRNIKSLPMYEVKKELEIIDVQLQGLNKQGVRLEKIIRDQCEGPNADPNATVIPIEAEDLILQLFEVVNEKNELCRRQAELMYLKRQHRLEEEHAEIEYEVRCLMCKSSKTDSDKARETELIERLVENVNLRAEIIECLEMDRVRIVEEDDSVAMSMNLYAQKRDEAAAKVQAEKSNESPTKRGKKKLKKKLLTLKRFGKLDIDKDIDESEPHSKSANKSLKKGKKK